MKEVDTITDAEILQLDSGQLRLLITTSKGHQLVYDCDTADQVEAAINKLVAASHKFNN